MSYNTGPATLKIGSGPYIYSEAGYKLGLKTKTGNVMSDQHGELGKFVQSRSVVISGKPTGVITAAMLASLLPSGVAIGGTLLGSADQNVEIWTLAGQKITWKRGGVTKFPELNLSATKPLFGGDFEVTCLGAATTSGQIVPTTAGHWNAIASTSFAEATFDPSKIQRYRYTAAFGSSPYDAMTAQEGFKVQINQEVEEIPDDNVGIADIVLKGITAGVTFTPSNLTEAQVWTLLGLQDATAILPGDLIGGATNLVIAGSGGSSGLSLTLNKCGFHDADMVYATGKLRTGEVQAVAARTFTTGVSDALWTFAVT